MSKSMGKLLSNPVRAWRDTPVTYVLISSIAMMSIWLGVIILSTTVHLPADRLVGYAGPMSLMPLWAWGWMFIIGGTLGMLRPLFHEARFISLLLHLVKMITLLSWALAFDFGGQPTTGQASYTFLAIITFLTPYLPAMIEHRYGRRPDPIDRPRRPGF